MALATNSYNSLKYQGLNDLIIFHFVVNYPCCFWKMIVVWIHRTLYCIPTSQKISNILNVLFTFCIFGKKYICWGQMIPAYLKPICQTVLSVVTIATRVSYPVDQSLTLISRMYNRTLQRRKHRQDILTPGVKTSSADCSKHVTALTSIPVLTCLGTEKDLSTLEGTVG